MSAAPQVIQQITNAPLPFMLEKLGASIANAQAALDANSIRLANEMATIKIGVGDEEHNLTLSANRVASVKALLIEQGVDENNIVTAALGESSPMQSQQDYQNDFFDRRVEIKLQPQQSLTASN